MTVLTNARTALIDLPSHVANLAVALHSAIVNELYLRCPHCWRPWIADVLAPPMEYHLFRRRISSERHSLFEEARAWRRGKRRRGHAYGPRPKGLPLFFFD